MKRFKMGVLNNLHTHKVYVTNRKIIYQGLTPEPNDPIPEPIPEPNPEPEDFPPPPNLLPKPPPNPFAKPPPNPFAKPPPNPFANLPKPPQFPPNLPK